MIGVRYFGLHIGRSFAAVHDLKDRLRGEAEEHKRKRVMMTYQFTDKQLGTTVEIGMEAARQLCYGNSYWRERWEEVQRGKVADLGDLGTVCATDTTKCEEISKIVGSKPLNSEQWELATMVYEKTKELYGDN